MRMKRKQLAGVLIGVLIALLGLLWFLQGAGVILLCPVLCITNCECVTGGSPFWVVAGAIAIMIGIGIVVVSVRGAGTP